ncbi:hypothetical protein SAMN05444671_3085 [Flavobacterium sp. CF108]|jgi:hypothetical protein|uniref:hypothetical protein n=1 Tax=unclassified Flavobacterium TaxID=196869 RepID=UPI0008BE9956|nr:MULTISPECIES: hypothetical protein [unclassified Flavobacterium]SEP30221.1 hypothetical protein SAMN04487978_0471 [Flavobacterium sp. fv08]SHH53487.1 hypothetical protein SAMN05444671_3085 [Flavobacterium sp. CF108]
MKDCINKISFPVLDISINNWNDENISEIIFYDIYFRNKSYDLFESLRLNHKVIDSNGSVFKIVELRKSKPSFINFFWKSKSEMIFQSLDETISLNNLKNFMINKINNLEVNEYKFKWAENVKNAQNFYQLIRAV